MSDSDRLLGLFERDIVVAAVALSGLALLLPGGGWWQALSVLAGAALIWFSFAAIRSSVDAVIGRRARLPALVKIFTRYGILAVAAYVILARLRLSPAWVVIGSTVLVFAAAAAAVRSLRPQERGPAAD
ncbi:MAG TPA: hypothetical protein VNK41_01995 [Vicinamibacterales bacterium]|nr:hypothetical protein [Vicinamibacterales bacterium]